MSENKITIRFRIGQIEVQLEGSRESVLDMLDKDLLKISESISRMSPGSAPIRQPLPSESTQINYDTMSQSVAVEQYPSITAQSCADAIVTLLSTEWGKKTPRTLAEIKLALESNALHYSGKVIGFTLTRLTRKQKVRRWKAEQGFIYTGGTTESRL